MFIIEMYSFLLGYFLLGYEIEVYKTILFGANNTM